MCKWLILIVAVLLNGCIITPNIESADEIVGGWECESKDDFLGQLYYRDKIDYNANGTFKKHSTVEIQMPGNPETYEIYIDGIGGWMMKDGQLTEHLSKYDVAVSSNIPARYADEFENDLDLPQKGVWTLKPFGDNQALKTSQYGQKLTCKKTYGINN